MRILMAALLAAATLTGPARAQQQPVVVELFTSQGCASCPPADRILGKLAARDDVIALALHVDYWDYIGWKDIFADPAYSRRQLGYVRAAGKRTRYTPQMIIDGVDHVVGARPMEVMDAIQKHRAADDPVRLRAERDGGKIAIHASVTGPAPDRMLVQIARYIPSETVAIKRGENRGKTLTYHNIVRDLQVLGEWNGEAPLSVSAPATGPTAVILQAPGYGPILAAAKVQ